MRGATRFMKLCSLSDTRVVEASQTLTSLEAPFFVAGRSPVVERVVRTRMIREFMRRLLIEYTRSEADSIVIQTDGKAGQCVVRQGREERLAVSLAPEWFEPICRWFGEHAGYCTAEELDPLIEVTGNESTLDFFANLRLEQQITTFRVRKHCALSGKQVLTIQAHETNRTDRVFADLGITKAQRAQLETLFEVPHGVVLVASPGREHLVRTLATFSTFWGACYAGELNEIDSYDAVVDLASDHLILISVNAGDVIEPLLQVRERCANIVELLSGAVCFGLVRRTCDGCARDAVVDARLVKQLPDLLRGRLAGKYLVGRGCSSCRQRGYRGGAAVLSILPMSEAMRDLVQAQADQITMVQVARSLGVQALLEDGIQKVAQGMVTLETVFGLIKTMPEAYLKVGATTKSPSYNSDDLTTIRVVDNFLSRDRPILSRPLSGRSAFSGDSSGGDDQPLFAFDRLKVERERPLLLVVEDDPDQQSILEMVLKGAQYEVRVANHGEEALRCIEQEFPDLIITDLMMPVMDGQEFVRQVKSNQLFRKIPVLVLTVISDVDKEYSLLDLGADDYCEKTIQRKILLKRVENLVRRKRR